MSGVLREESLGASRIVRPQIRVLGFPQKARYAASGPESGQIGLNDQFIARHRRHRR